MKNEIKLEFNNTIFLKDIIESTYFDDGQKGKLCGKKKIEINPDLDNVFYLVVNGLDKSVVKVTNSIIDGSMRFMVDESDSVTKLIPISIYCVKIDDKYSFY